MQHHRSQGREFENIILFKTLQLFCCLLVAGLVLFFRSLFVLLLFAALSLCAGWPLFFGVLLGKGPLLQLFNIWNQYSWAGYLWDQGAQRL